MDTIETIVTLTEEDGKWRMVGTTFLEPDMPWPIDMTFNTKPEADFWIEKHGYTVEP